MIPAVALALLLGSGAAFAQTGTSTGTMGTTTMMATPGAPNTGTGGEAAENIALLAAAAGAAGASLYLLRRKES